MNRPDGIESSPRWMVRLLAAGPLVVALCLLALVAMLWGAWRWLDPTPDRHIVIATGPAQGAYAELAERYLPYLRTERLQVELRATQGSAENLALLRDPASGVQAAFVQSGGDNPAAASGADLVSLGRVAYEPIWIFYRRERTGPKGRPAPPPQRLTDLAGWRINTGPAGGGGGPLFVQLAAANGLTTDAMTLDSSPSVQGVVALVQGSIDALVMVAAPDAPLVQYLLQTPEVALLPFPQAEAYARRLPFLRAVTLPRGLVDLAGDRPPQDVPLVAASASLVARADLHPALVQLLVQAARQVHGEPGWFQSAGELPSPATDGLPLSPEAERFYRDGKPWLQRYLPFWLANFIDRMWFVLLPLLAAMVPLSRVLPPLVSLRLRSRVFRWYAHLRAIETALDAPDADLPALRDRLERTDRQVEHIGLPLAFTHELYQLRAHINLVRKRLQGRESARKPAHLSAREGGG
ncbi:TAXI family TRAP transporter solute-binding subunit [Rubrivivax albus]|uniref:C4-dicarboxylate ABC transporter substrate-binding protein n=1 Tax=Rubrivivax albus TaxID=2499835 RepID=A0A3S2U5C8_9BURK|nr:TAXI family TRAP transporter solute-binding subunit [Rubrivivax albus]RVT54045.1 C4-dicarboxylate ABC transporter substrate-binding protein [Rubrivivax albus]